MTKNEFIFKNIKEALDSRMTKNLKADTLAKFTGHSFLSSFVDPDPANAATVVVDLGKGITLSLVTGPMGGDLADKVDFLQTAGNVTAVQAELKLKIAFNGQYSMNNLFIDLSGMNKVITPAANLGDTTNAHVLTANAPDKSLLTKMVTQKNDNVLVELLESLSDSKAVLLNSINSIDDNVKEAYSNYLIQDQIKKTELNTEAVKDLEESNATKLAKTQESIDTIKVNTESLSSSYTIYAVYAIAIMAAVSLGLSVYQMNNNIDSVKTFNDEIYSDI